MLVAHHDAGRGGLALGRRLRRRLGAQPLLWAQLAVLACCGVRLAGAEGIALSPTRAGENDNASGVALALALAGRFRAERLEHFEVHVLSSGAQKAMATGMRGFLGRHRAELGKEHTLFLNLDEVGSGRPRYARKEGPLLSLTGEARLMEPCGTTAFVNRTPSDAYAARVRGFPPSRSAVVTRTAACTPASRRRRSSGPRRSAPS